MRLTLAAMTLSSSMILVDQTAVPLATPHAIEGLHASISESQWLMTANILPLAALMVFGGRLDQDQSLELRRQARGHQRGESIPRRATGTETAPCESLAAMPRGGSER